MLIINYKPGSFYDNQLYAALNLLEHDHKEKQSVANNIKTLFAQLAQEAFEAGRDFQRKYREDEDE